MPSNSKLIFDSYCILTGASTFYQQSWMCDWPMTWQQQRSGSGGSSAAAAAWRQCGRGGGSLAAAWLRWQLGHGGQFGSRGRQLGSGGSSLAAVRPPRLIIFIF